MFVTVWIGILDFSTGKMVCANAGHEYPAIYRKGGNYELLKDKHGFVLGGMENIRQYEYEIQLHAGDKVFLYTDGVTEATDAKEELYGDTRMVSVLNTVVDGTMEETLAAVKNDIDRFVGDVPQFDDITMMCLEYLGASKDKEKAVKELTLEATIENVQTVTNFAEKEMEQMGVPLKVQTQINIAIDEMFSNIAKYAYQKGTGMVTVRIQQTDDPNGVALTFIDGGFRIIRWKRKIPM